MSEGDPTEETHPEPVELCQLPTDQAHLLGGLLEAAGLEVDLLDNDMGRLGAGPAIRSSQAPA